jgi:hypothetical protein
VLCCVVLCCVLLGTKPRASCMPARQMLCHQTITPATTTTPFWDRVLAYGPWWPWNHLPASASQVLGVQTCAITLSSPPSYLYLKFVRIARCWWLIPIILATQEAEIRRIMVRSQSRQILHETLSQKTFHKNRTEEVAQGEGPEFKPQYWNK